jgi:3D (Asp-Asp-Asp) domain-containing protein
MHTLVTTALMGLLLLTGGNAETQKEPETFITHSVAMTGYNAVPEQTDSDPTTTASGARSNPETIVARSVDLAEDLPFGTVIEITSSATSTSCGLPLVGGSIGYRVVADSMHPRKRNQIDIMFDATHAVTVGGKKVNAARALGVCKDVEIRVVGEVDIKNIPRDQAELKRVVEEQRLAIRK